MIFNHKRPFTRLMASAILLVVLAFIIWQRAAVVEATNQSDESSQTNHIIRINEIMAGANGDSTIQFIEMEIDGGQHLWGPQGSETVGRAMLTFSDAQDNQTGRFVFSSDAPNPANSNGFVLIATQAFADLPDAPTPDFIMPEEIMAISGKVCFEGNPDNNGRFNITLCVSYGDFDGSTQETSGSPVPDTLPILGTMSLRRVQNMSAFGSGSNSNDDFRLNAPDPMNSQGDTFSFPSATQVEQGRILFLEETFNGNGRTCGSCHTPQDSFGLTAETVSTFDDNDPFFVANFNLNTLVLTDDAQPSDLRGEITASNGQTATVLAGIAERTYLVYGGQGMNGTLTDGKGNSGTIESFTEGDLDELENSTLISGGRALILENIDGFDEAPVMRSSPHLLNIDLTAPYGWSGDIPDLLEFSKGAVTQHAPRRINREVGVDFRLPTDDELVAMDVFMRSIRLPADGDLDLDRFVVTEQERRGRDLFFNEAKCSKCHDGLALAASDGSLLGSTQGKNENFNTGVAMLSQNSNLPPGDLTREFNTSPLFGIARTAPFFHDNSVATLREAVEFYDSREFVNSPAGELVGAITVLNNEQNVQDIVAFLEALGEIPDPNIPTPIPTPTFTPTPTPTPMPSVPEINLSSNSIDVALNQNQSEDKTLRIRNDGTATLNWSIDEAIPARRLSDISQATQLGLTQASGNDTTLSHSTSQSIVVPNSVVCGNEQTGFTARNSYYRVFDLINDFGINAAFNVTSIEFGVEKAVAQNGTQPITVNLYTLNGELLQENLTQIGSETISLSDQTGSIVNVPLNRTVPVNSTLVVEVLSENEDEDSNTFLIGSNNAGQSDQSYIRAPSCNLNEITDLASLDFSAMHIVMNVNGKVNGDECAAPSDIPWLTLSSTSGSTSGNGNSSVNLTFDSTGLAPGTHKGTLCVNSNDPTTPRIRAALELIVSSVPPIPSSITLEAEGSPDNINVGWTLDEPLSGELDDYELLRNADGGEFTVITSSTNSQHTDDDPNLSVAVAYCYKVRALDRDGNVIGISNLSCTEFGSLTIWIPDQVAQPQDTNVPVKINLANGNGLCIRSLDIKVSYDQNMVKANGTVLPTIFTQDYQFVANTETLGEIKISAIASARSGGCQDLFGGGSLFDVFFDITGSQGEVSSLSFITGLTGTVIYDSDDLVNFVPLALQPGSLGIEWGFVRGDINGNGTVNEADGALALNASSGAIHLTPQQEAACDVNGDGTCNAADASLIFCFVRNQDWNECGGATARHRNAQIEGAPAGVTIGEPTQSGQTFLFPLSVNNARDLAGGNFTFVYDPDKMTAIGASLTSLTSNFELQSNSSEEGILSLSLAGDTPIAEDGTILNLQFAINPGEVTLNFGQVRLNDATGRDFETSALQREIEVAPITTTVDTIQNLLYLPVIIR